MIIIYSNETYLRLISRILNSGSMYKGDITISVVFYTEEGDGNYCCMIRQISFTNDLDCILFKMQYNITILPANDNCFSAFTQNYNALGRMTISHFMKQYEKEKYDEIPLRPLLSTNESRLEQID